MANTTALYVRIDNDLKSSAEEILAELGITPSGAVQMFYRQIILHNGIPFDLRLPPKKPVFTGSMTDEEVREEIVKGAESLKKGRAYSDEEVERILADDRTQWQKSTE